MTTNRVWGVTLIGSGAAVALHNGYAITPIWIGCLMVIVGAYLLALP